jgi:3-methylcrotonyl-CoA carboxylase beta subunit
MQDNAAALNVQIEDLRKEVTRIELGGDEKARSLHKKRGKLLARERIQGLLDTGYGL